MGGKRGIRLDSGQLGRWDGTGLWDHRREWLRWNMGNWGSTGDVPALGCTWGSRGTLSQSMDPPDGAHTAGAVRTAKPSVANGRPMRLSPCTPQNMGCTPCPRAHGPGAVAESPQIPRPGSSWLQTLPAPLHSLGRQYPGFGGLPLRSQLRRIWG